MATAERPRRPRRRGGSLLFILLLLVILAAALYFLLGGTFDLNFRADPPDVQVDPGNVELPDVEVNPASPAEAASPR